MTTTWTSAINAGRSSGSRSKIRFNVAALDLVDDDWRVYGYDYGWRDPRVILEVGKTSYDQLVVLDEYHERETHLEDAVEWLKQNDKPEGAIYCDHDPEDIRKLTRAGYQAARATKDIDEGIAEVRKRLETDGNREVDTTSPGPKIVEPAFTEPIMSTATEQRQSVSERSPGGTDTTSEANGDDTPPAAEAAEPQVGLLISANCEHLVREFLGYKEEHVGTSQAVDHCLDSLRYLCMGVAGRGASGPSGSGTW